MAVEQAPHVVHRLVHHEGQVRVPPHGQALREGPAVQNTYNLTQMVGKETRLAILCDFHYSTLSKELLNCIIIVQLLYLSKNNLFAFIPARLFDVDVEVSDCGGDLDGVVRRPARVGVAHQHVQRRQDGSAVLDAAVNNLMLNLKVWACKNKGFLSFKFTKYLMSVTGSPPSFSWKRLYPCK